MTDKESTPLIAVRLPAAMPAEIDQLARAKYLSRSDAIRDALRTLLRGQSAADIYPLAVSGLNEKRGEAA